MPASCEPVCFLSLILQLWVPTVDCCCHLLPPALPEAELPLQPGHRNQGQGRWQGVKDFESIKQKQFPRTESVTTKIKNSSTDFSINDIMQKLSTSEEGNLNGQSFAFKGEGKASFGSAIQSCSDLNLQSRS